MKTLEALLDAVAERDISLWVEDGRLRMRAPAGAMTPALRAELKARKPDLIEHLSQPDAPPGAPQRPDTAHDPFPLTPIQHAYWVGRQALVDDAMTATWSYLEFDLPAVDVPRIEAVLDALVRRHPMLRAVVDADGRQRVLPEVPQVEVEVVDLSALDEPTRAARLADRREALSHRILPAESGRLFEVCLSRLTADRVRLHLGVDLLVVDVGGAMQLIDEGLALYDDLDAALPAVGYTFREYRLAELAEHASDAHRRSRAWWAARLADLPPAPALPTRAASSAGRFRRRQRILDAARWSALQAAARAWGVTPAAALCAAYAEVLANWSRQAPFTLNLTLFAKQPYHPDVPRVVGDFTAVTLLPFDPHGGADFAARAQAVQQTLWSTLEHTRISGVEVLRMLNEGRPLAEQARMPVVFTAALGATSVDPRVALGLDHMVHGVSQTPQVSLDHQAVEVGDRLVLNWDAVEERFPPRLLDAMFAAYNRALDALADDDAAWRAARWPSLPPQQADRRAKYLDTAGPEPSGTLFDAFDRQRTRQPDAPALIAERTLSYAEVAARAAAVQRALAVEPGALVAIAMPPHWAQAVAALGVLRAGAAYVPLDAGWPPARVDGIIERAGVTRVLTLASLDRAWPVPAIAVDTLAPDPSPPPPAPQDPRALAYIIYTSGSTGVPKGVVIDHRGAANTLADINDRFAVGPTDRVLALSSLAFDLSVYDLFGLLAAGGAVAVPAPETAREPAIWLDRLRADRVTLWNTVPALMALLVEHAEQTGAELPASLRLILLSGDWIPVTLPDRIRALAPDPDALEIISLGGATEGSIWSIIHPIGAVDRSRPSVPYGRPLRNQRMYVRHPDGAPCPEWAVGEIAIGGVGVALGYHDDPARTAERFIEQGGERLYRTGDLGRMWPDGTMEFLGREDHQVKVGGHRIELGEIEATLLGHPGVSAAVVDVDGDPKRLVGWIVPRAGLSTDAWDAARALPPPTVNPDDAAAMRADIEALDALAVAYMVRTLRALGAFAEPGAPVAVDDLVALGVRPGYRPIVTDWLDALTARALLRRVDGAWIADTPLPALAIEPLLERARAVSHPDALALVQRMAAAHVDVLCDRRDAIEIFFADGLRFARAIYGELGPIRLEVERLARLIGVVVDALDRPARLIEIGGGSGEICAALIDTLPPDRWRLDLTDVSRFFLDAARARFGHRSEVRPRTYDMNRAPAAQGFEPGEYDVVVAYAVLHNAPDLAATFDHLRALLAPGGVLVVSEVITPTPYLLAAPLLMDHDAPRSVFEPVERWRTYFEGAGLTDFTALDGCLMPSAALMLARAPEASTDGLRGWLGARLPAYMVPAELMTMTALPLGANSKVDRRLLPRVERATDGEAPRGPVEAALAALWAEHLGRPVGRDEDFFAAGGESLLAVRLVGALRSRFGVELPLRSFFAHPTIAALAPLCTPSAAAPPPAAEQAVTPDPAGRFEPFPLTEVQRAYWLGRESLELGGVPCQLYLELDSPLPPDRLERAWRALVDRHDALRLVIDPDGGGQRVRPTAPEPLVTHADLRATPDAGAHLARRRAEMSVMPLDPATGPLVAVHLSRLADRRTRIHVLIDALCADASSIVQLMTEWAALATDPDTPLAPIGLTFRDCALARRAQTDSPARQRAAAYWSARIPDLPGGPQLPALPPTGRPTFRRHHATLDPPAWRALQARCARAGVTPSALLLAAYARVLARWSRSPHFCLNVTLFDRAQAHPDIARVVGDFTTLDVLEVAVEPAEPTLDLARRVADQLWADLDHRALDGVEVIQQMARHRGRAGGATLPVVFTSALGFDLADDAQSSIGEIVHSVSQTPQVWLDHQVWSMGGQLILSWDALDALFPPGLIDAMFEAYVGLVRRLAAAEADAVALPPAQADRRAALIATERPVPDALLHTRLMQQATRRPDAPAIITPDRTLTYAEVACAARHIGARVAASRPTDDALVAVLAPKGWPQIVGLVGVLVGGGAYLPIDPALPESRITWLLDHGRVRAVVTTPALASTLPAGVEPIIVTAALLTDPPPTPPATRTPDDLAYVIYTSGSTGQPKGVAIDHRGAVNTIDDVCRTWAITADDRVFGISSASFDLSVFDIFGTLGAGGALVLPPPSAHPDPARWAAQIARHRVTVWSSVPALMDLLATHGDPLPSLRLVMLSGDWIPVSLPDRVRALAPDADVLSLGGATEASIWSVWFPIGAVDPAWPSIPYGRPMANQRLYVLDDALELRPDGVPGELYIAGVGLARGYWRAPELTAARFVTHPRTGERLYRTGDFARYRPDGDLEFLGREDTQVKVGGHRIELGEIEAALSRQPGVEAAAVTLAGDPRGDRRLIGWVVPAGDDVDKAQFTLRQPARRRDLDAAPTVTLTSPPPDPDRWTRRRSARAFTDQPVPLAELGALLAGLRALDRPGAPLPKYRYPSAGSLYPVQIYIFAARVDGLAPGGWYFDPRDHHLRAVGETLPAPTWHRPRNHALAARAAFHIALVAARDAIEPMYGPFARDLCLLEAGYIGQLLETHAGPLGLCAVGGLDPDAALPALGLGDRHWLVHAYVGGRPDADATDGLDAARLRAALGDTLPSYMVPATIRVIGALPLTANGKVDRKALTVTPPASTGPTRAGAALEARIAEITEAVTGFAVGDPDANLFDLGCTSLHIVRVHRRLRDTLRTSLSVADLFRAATVAGIAEAVAAADALANDAIGAISSEDAPTTDAIGAADAIAATGGVAVTGDMDAMGAADAIDAVDAIGASRAIPTNAAEPAPPATRRRDDIAIVGLAARFPGARDVDAFWRALEAGACAIRDFDPLDGPGDRGPDHVAAGATIDDPFDFDAEFFRCTPREAELLDPQIRLFVEHCHLALEDAGVDPTRAPRVGVFAGQSHSTHHDRAQAAVTDPASRFLTYVSNDKDYLATQAAWRLGLTGPALAIQTACSTSLVAVHVAGRSLVDGECDVALAGGVTVHTPQATGYDPGVTGIFSPTGRCRPFEARSDGTVFGNGVGVVALRRLDDALRDGDTIYAVIRGSAVNNDGPRRVGFTAPGQDGQVEVIRAALARADVDPATITYVEAHGTGTPLGDPIEAAALCDALDAPGRPPCILGAVKGNVGHLESAAGVAGLIKTALALHHGVLPPQPDFRGANPRIPFAEMPLRVLDAREPWTPPAGVPRRAGVSSFGIGGTNAHVVLEQAPPQPTRHRDGPWVLPLSTRRADDLPTLAAAVRALPGPLRDLCYTAALGRRAHPHRLAIVADTLPAARDALDAFLDGRSHPRLFVGEATRGRAPVAPTDPHAAARAWVDGAPVAWRFDGARKLRMPGHPLHPRRFCVEPAPTAPPPAAHPLYDHLLPTAAGEWIAHGRLDLDRLPWVADHVIGGAPILPGTAWFALVIAAGRAARGEADLIDVSIERPLSLAEPAVVELRVDPRGDFRAASSPAPGRDPWTTHLRGRLGEPAPADDPIDLDALRARCPHRRPAADVRAWHAERAIAYGPAWHGLGDVWFGERELIASITTPPALRGHRHGAHPALVDTGLSALAALATTDHDGRTRVPIGAERVRLPRALPAEWVAHGRMRSETVAELTLYTREGRWLGAIEGLTLHPIAADAGQAEHSPLRGAAWDVRWRRCDRRGAAELPPGAWLVLDAADGPPIGRWLRDVGLDCRTAPSPDVIGVIDARGLDARDVDDAGPAAARLLTLVRDLVADEAALPGGLWVLTRGATPVGAELRPLALAQAPLIGLARTAATEHPELGVCLLDLDPDGAGEDPPALLAELAIGGRDGEVALRREGRFVARLAPHPTPPPAPPGLPDTDDPFTLLTGEGGIDGLHFGVLERPPVDGDLVEVAVHATGLNFRDVLGALALYAGGPIPVGGEIAGVVTAVGPDVSRFAPGDPVLGLAAHAFSDRIVTAETLLAPKPPALSFERAAAVPLVWLTAWYGLFEIGGLRAGHRVLVHSAAGGVGLAAVELARAAGAEVIATASPAKWPLLRARGVERCYNSRTPDFGAAIEALGGVDIVLSALTLDGIRASFEALRPGGVLVDIGKTDPTAEPWFAAATKDRRYRPYDLGEHARSADGVHGPLAQIVGDLTAGRLRASPRAVFPIDRAVDAFRSMARGRHVGKIVVSQAARRRRLAGLPDRWPADRAVLITGGLGGLGSALATWLVDRGARRLVLMSRRGADTPARRGAVAALEANGARITVVTADVADAEAVEAVMRRHEPMGVVHAAGVLADAPLARQTDAELAAVLAPKVRGAWNLHRAARDLDVFALFGSLSAVAGTPGQAAYAAANAFLDRLAAHRRAMGLAATCIAWGPWAEVGMAARMSADRRAHIGRTIEALSTARGLAAFGRVLDDDPAHIVVAPLRAESVPAAPLYSELHAGTRAEAGLDADLAARLTALDPDAARALVRDEIAACVRRVVGLDPDAWIDGQTPFIDLGVDSLMSIEIRNALGAALGRPLPATLLFEEPTPDALARRLVGAPAAAAPTVAAPPPPTPEAPADGGLDGLSATELAALLRAELEDD